MPGWCRGGHSVPCAPISRHRRDRAPLRLLPSTGCALHIPLPSLRLGPASVLVLHCVRRRHGCDATAVFPSNGRSCARCDAVSNLRDPARPRPRATSRAPLRDRPRRPAAACGTRLQTRHCPLGHTRWPTAAGGTAAHRRSQSPPAARCRSDGCLEHGVRHVGSRRPRRRRACHRPLIGRCHVADLHIGLVVASSPCAACRGANTCAHGCTRCAARPAGPPVPQLIRGTTAAASCAHTAHAARSPRRSYWPGPHRTRVVPPAAPLGRWPCVGRRLVQRRGQRGRAPAHRPAGAPCDSAPSRHPTQPPVASSCQTWRTRRARRAAARAITPLGRRTRPCP